MRFLKYFLIILLSTGLTLFVVSGKLKSVRQEIAIDQVSLNAAGVSRMFNSLTEKIDQRLEAFGRIVSDDMDFAMTLTIDKDISAPAISEFALQYLEPMGLDFLEIIDSNEIIISSAHFPSSNGNKSLDFDKYSDFQFGIKERDLKGQKFVTLCKKVPFNCSGVKLFVLGGIILSDEMIKDLALQKECNVLIKNDEKYLGMDIKSINEIKNHHIIINDSVYIASSSSLSISGNPEIIVFKSVPREFTLFDLFK